MSKRTFITFVFFFNSDCDIICFSKFITSTMFCAGTMTTGEGACDVRYIFASFLTILFLIKVILGLECTR